MRFRTVPASRADGVQYDGLAMTERTITSRTAFTGRLLTLRVETVALDDGRETTREIVQHPGAVAILPWDGERVALVRQWRHPAGRDLLEVPAGTLDPGEEPAATARRELAEEVGVSADGWVTGPAFFTAPGFCTEHLTVFLATGLHPAPGAGHDPDEQIEVTWMTLSDALGAIDDGSIEDGKSIAALLWLARRLGDGGAIGPPTG
jgi:ADP-ribose pyrophosphatase